MRFLITLLLLLLIFNIGANQFDQLRPDATIRQLGPGISLKDKAALKTMNQNRINLQIGGNLLLIIGGVIVWRVRR